MSANQQSLPYLVMFRGAKPFYVFPLRKTTITIGRARNNDIVLMDRRISRYHARLTYQLGQWVIEDLGSDNGVWVNGVRISGPAVVQDDNIISLGQAVQFEMELKPDIPEGVGRRRILPKWLLPSSILWIGGIGGVILVVLGLAVLAVAGYFWLGFSQGPPQAAVDTDQEQPAVVDVTDQGADADLALDMMSSPGPEVVIIDMEPALHIPLGGSFNLSASAYDDDNVVRMDLWVDDQLAFSQTLL